MSLLKSALAKVSQMRPRRLVLSLVAVSTLAASVAAAEDPQWDKRTEKVRVLQVTTLQSGNFYIRTDKAIYTGAGKDTTAGLVYVSNGTLGGHAPTVEGRQMMLSTALAAYLSSRTVEVFADNPGTAWGCKVGAIQLEN